MVWADDLGVTFRRWNWRQGTRTRRDALVAGAHAGARRLWPLGVSRTVSVSLFLAVALLRREPWKVPAMAIATAVAALVLIVSDL